MSFASLAEPAIAGTVRQVGEYRLVILHTLDEIEALRDDWQDLERRAGDYYAYFQSFDWCANWCRVFEGDSETGDGQIVIACIYRDKLLVGLLPLVISRRPLGVRALCFLGEPLSQYGNILVDRNAITTDALGQIWEVFRGEVESDSIVLERFPSFSPLAKIVESKGCSAPRGQFSSHMDLTRYDGWEDFQASLTRSARKSRNRRRKKLNALGVVEQRVESGRSEGFREIAEAAIQHKTEWLQETGRRMSEIADPNTLELLCRLPGDAEAASGALAFGLFLDGAPIAAEIGFAYGPHYYSYLGAFDWSLRDYSPGKVQLESALYWCFENGMAHYDFLGNPSSYKDDWSNRTLPLMNYSSSNSARGYLYAHHWKPLVKPAAKRLFHTLPVPVRRGLAGMAGGSGSQG